MAYTTFIGNHEYKEEPLHYSGRVIRWWFFIPEIEYFVDRVGCLCGNPKDDRIHQPLRPDKY